MTNRLIESLEPRQLLSGSTDVEMSAAAMLDGSAATGADAQPAAPTRQRTADRRTKRPRVNNQLTTTALSPQDVQRILGQAASQARPTQAIAVVDRFGTLLGLYGGSGLNAAESDSGLGSLTGEVVQRAIQRARTAAFFESTENAFTTRTARFIIQNQFPQPIRNTGGGPLYGVEFSNLPGSDIIPTTHQGVLSGDPGGMPLFLRGVPVGGIGVAGDMSDISPTRNFREIFSAGPYGRVANPPDAEGLGQVFRGREEADFDESVAMAGSRGFTAPAEIRATRIFVVGVRFPYTASRRAAGQPDASLDQLTSQGRGQLLAAPSAGLPAAITRAGEPERVNATIAGEPGLLRITNNRQIDPATGRLNPTLPARPIQDTDPIIDSNDAIPERLTAQDVMTIMEDAVRTSIQLRAGIRRPLGVEVRVHIAVVDRDGDVLGAFRMLDGTNFSYDVAVQKARTAALFSDDQHALTPRAIGFMSQRFFPAGIESGVRGPLYFFQDSLSFGPDFQQLLNGNLGQNLAATGFRNGITIFPGGVPLYRNGVLIGGLGISGDGVEEDDQIAFGGGMRYQPALAIRSDLLSGPAIREFVLGRLREIENSPGADVRIDGPGRDDGRLPSVYASQSLGELNELRLPYVKFKRNPRL